MASIDDAWTQAQRRRWLRPDAQRWVRPDAARFMRPNAERFYRPDAWRAYAQHLPERKDWQNRRASLQEIPTAGNGRMAAEACG